MLIAISAAGCRHPQQHSAEWDTYCEPDIHDISRARVRIGNPLAQQAEQALNALPADAALLIPGELRAAYDEKHSRPRAFLDILCGEYRDNGALLEAKLRLLARIVRVKPGVQRYSRGADIWPQLTASGFRQLVHLTRALQEFRLSNSTEKVPRETSVLDGCELRFMFREYLARGAAVLTRADFEEYERNLRNFRGGAGEECSSRDRTAFLLFRGTGFISPRDPESATLRQVGIAMGKVCSKERSFIPSALGRVPACEEFFGAPYAARRRIALQILRRILTPKYEEFQQLKNRDVPVFLTEDLDGDGVGEAVFPGPAGDKQDGSASMLAFTRALNDYLRLPEKERKASEDPRPRAVELLDSAIENGGSDGMRYVTKTKWRPEFSSAPDSGLGRIYDLNGPEGKIRLRRLLSIVLARHAFFYRTLLYLKRHGAIFPSTTPLLSASADLSQAFKFAVRGFAADRMRLPKLGWMFVFRVDRSNRYTDASIVAGTSPNFDRDWLDEATLTNFPYALEERGVDRFGEPSPEEFEALLYLGDVPLPAELLVLLKTKSFDQVKQHHLDEGAAHE